MFTCSLDALKKSSKKKEMRIKKEKVEVLQQTRYSRKETGCFRNCQFSGLLSIVNLLVVFEKSIFRALT